MRNIITVIVFIFISIIIYTACPMIAGRCTYDEVPLQKGMVEIVLIEELNSPDCEYMRSGGPCPPLFWLDVCGQ